MDQRNLMDIQKSEFGNTEFHILIAKNDFKNLKNKIDQLDDPLIIFNNALDKISNSLLHKAVFSGNLKICKFLIEKKHQVTCVNIFGQSPLHIAYINNNTSIIKLLIESGASHDIRDIYNNLPTNFGNL